ncbi:hypothetical protein [Paenibacillus glycanilyticus]|uniref:Uncharacterized protein n=1 Tax=Paenibacillus glycanilyticus TaxID=126569 RepID=A0ABQ6GM17_9BACL|nr:hypothetical protein [Paenibacillus glycanilyticus]GLX70671.1 hypothetical protein MU1_50170 [Paenibacillus glycanilyticus]
MSNKKNYYSFEDPSGTTVEYRATSLQQAMVIKKKIASELGMDKEEFALTNISNKRSEASDNTEE